MQFNKDNRSNGKSRLRTPTPKNIAQDLALLMKGVLDYGSFISAYRWHNHPVEAVLTDKAGTVKHIRRTHNLRTNVGGADQGQIMSGTLSPGKAQYIGLAISPITPNDTDQWLGGSGSSANVESLSIARQLATFTFVTPPGGNSGSTAQGTYRLGAVWNSISVGTVTSVYGCAVFGGPTVGTPGSDMWFEASLSTAIPVGNGDNLTLSYTVNF